MSKRKSCSESGGATGVSVHQSAKSLERLLVQFQSQQQQLRRKQLEETTQLRTQQAQQKQQLTQLHQQRSVLPEQRREQLHALHQRHEIARARLEKAQRAKMDNLQRKQQKFFSQKQEQFESQAQHTKGAQPTGEQATPAQPATEGPQQRVVQAAQPDASLQRANVLPGSGGDARREADVADVQEQTTAQPAAVEDMREDSSRHATTITKRLPDNDASSRQLDDEVVARDADVSRIRSDFDALRRENADAVSGLDSRLTAAMDAIRGLTEEASDKLAALGASLIQLSADHTALSTKVERLVTTPAVDRTAARDKSSQDEIQQRRQEIAALREEVRTLRSSSSHHHQADTQSEQNRHGSYTEPAIRLKREDAATSCEGNASRTHVDQQLDHATMAAVWPQVDASRAAQVAVTEDVVQRLVDPRVAELDARLTQALQQQQQQIALTQQVIAMYDAAQRRISELEEKLQQQR